MGNLLFNQRKCYYGVWPYFDQKQQFEVKYLFLTNMQL